MKKCILLGSLLTVWYQVVASANYDKMRDLIRKNMSTVQGAPHDVSEYRAQVIFSRDDVYGQAEEILQLSDAGHRLYETLTHDEKAKLPRIVIATPGSYAMKFSCARGCLKIITMQRPTVADLDRAIHEAGLRN
jgi:hypothetical protein